EMARLSVDLPTPFEPSTATISPGSTFRSTPRSTSVSQSRAHKPRMSSSGAIGIVSGDMRAPHSGGGTVTQIGLDDDRIGDDLGRAALRDDAALGQHEDMLGEAHHRLHDMLDHQHGDAAGRERADHRHNVADFRGVESSQNLVEQKQLRF